MAKKQVLAVLYPGCIEQQIMLATQLLAPQMTVRVATPDGSEHSGANGMKIRPDGAFEKMVAEEFAAVLVPGGDPRSALGNNNLRQILVKANITEAVIGGICAGPLVLGDAGILHGKRVAHGYQRKQLESVKTYFGGAIMSDRMVEMDGNIVTAKPNAFVDFAIAIARTAGVLNERRRYQFLQLYYRGLNPGIYPLAGITSVYIYVSDVFESIGWYEQIFETQAESNDGEVGVLRVGHQEITFCAADDKSRPSVGGTVANYWAERLERTVERIKMVGGDILRGPIEMADGRCLYHIRDPFGNVFGVEGIPFEAQPKSS